jgi:hypothetical protein
MIHDLTAGHFGQDGSVAKPLDMRIVRRLLDELGEVDAGSSPTLDGWKVRFEGACVILPWKGGLTNRAAEEFAIRLQRETGRALQDQEHGRVFQAGQLAAERSAAG